MRLKTKRLAAPLVVLVVAMLAIASPASAPADAPPSLGDGGMFFSAIHGPADPEEYSWTVTLGEEQVLRDVDDQHAVVEYSGGHNAFSIWALPAHDADGTTVLTTIAVTGRNVVTLTVHHRAGDPANGGAPFDYPVVGGTGWSGGFHTEIVEGPPDEQQQKQQQKKPKAAETERAPASCHVPNLRGRSIRKAWRALRDSDCILGTINHRRTKGSARIVVRQGKAPGTVLPAGSPIWVTVGG